MTFPQRLNAGVRTGLLLLFFAFFLTDSFAAISLPQSDGSVLTLEQPARRVVTLAPNIAEMMYDAGAGSSMLATVEYSNFPAEAAHLPRIGDAFRFDLERIMALKPDLVIAWNSGNPAAALDRLESLGLNVWRTELRSPADIAGLLRNLALATGMSKTGVVAARKVEQRLATLVEQYQGQDEVRYFYQVAERPLFTLNGAHIVSQGLALCGAVNVFADESVLAPQVTREAVLVADPDVLFAPRIPESPDPLEHWKAWPRLKAVSNGDLYHLEADKISRATPRMLDSLELACTLLHQYRSRQQENPEPL